MISRLELQQDATPTHSLKAKDRNDQHARFLAWHHTHLLPTRAKDKIDQPTKIAAKHHAHSQTGEPRTDILVG